MEGNISISSPSAPNIKVIRRFASCFDSHPDGIFAQSLGVQIAWTLLALKVWYKLVIVCLDCNDRDLFTTFM